MRLAALAFLLLPAAASPSDTERRYMVTGFDRIRVTGPFEVEVVPGGNAASASGAPLALDRLSVRVEGNTLVINSGTGGWERRVRDAPAATRVRVSAPMLRALSANGGAVVHVAQMRAARIDLALEGTGSVDVGEVRADQLFVGHNGMGVLKLAGSAGEVRVRGAVAAAVDGTDFTARDATLLWESRGPLTIGVRYTARISATGQGAVTILGKPHCTVTGPGPVTCEGIVERR